MFKMRIESGVSYSIFFVCFKFNYLFRIWNYKGGFLKTINGSFQMERAIYCTLTITFVNTPKQLSQMQ